jgi:hypothetical protein
MDLTDEALEVSDAVRRLASDGHPSVVVGPVEDLTEVSVRSWSSTLR